MQNLLKVLLLGTVLVNSDCFAGVSYQLGKSGVSYRGGVESSQSTVPSVASNVVTGTDAGTSWYQPLFSKSASSVYNVGDTTTIVDPVMGKMTGTVSAVNGSTVTLDYGGSYSTFSTGTSGHIVESTGQNFAKGFDIPTDAAINSGAKAVVSAGSQTGGSVAKIASSATNGSDFVTTSEIFGRYDVVYDDMGGKLGDVVNFKGANWKYAGEGIWDETSAAVTTTLPSSGVAGLGAGSGGAVSVSMPAGSSPFTTSGTFNNLPVTQTSLPSGTEITLPGGAESYVVKGTEAMRVTGDGVDLIYIKGETGSQMLNVRTGDSAFQATGDGMVSTTYLDAKGQPISEAAFNSGLQSNSNVTPTANGGATSGAGTSASSGTSAGASSSGTQSADVVTKTQEEGLKGLSRSAETLAKVDVSDFSSWLSKRASELGEQFAGEMGSWFSNGISEGIGDLPIGSGFSTELARLGGADLGKSLSKMGTNMTAASSELSKAIGENGGLFGTSTSFDSVKDLGPLALQNAVKDQLAKKIGDQLMKEATEKYGEEFAKSQAEAINKQAEEQAAKQVAELLPIKVLTQNVVQYALVIAEALKGNEIDDATKEVTVKGAEPMQESQGSQGGGASTASAPSSAMAGTTIAGSANALISLLNMGKIDLSLLSTDIKKEEQKEVKKAVTASAGKSGADVGASAQTSTQPEEETLTTDEQREIMHRRALLLGEWATAATQIGEGSNAISRAFYDRAKAFEAAANAAQGSLGGITAITDTDRFVLFEITRGAALSAVQLGLQGAANLNDLEEVATSIPDNDSAKPSVSVSGAKSQ